jgi:hypothetical protein
VKKKKRELTKAKDRLKKAEQNYGQKVYDNTEKKRRTVRGFKISNAELGLKINRLRKTCERLEAEAKALPDRVPVGSLMNGKAVVRLERERKIITDTLKMVAYRAETQLANLVGPLLPFRGDEARKFMRQVFELPADLLPDYEQGQLIVRLHSMANPRSNHALSALCVVLNDLNVCYPGTKLRLVLEAPEQR